MKQQSQNQKQKPELFAKIKNKLILLLILVSPIFANYTVYDFIYSVPVTYDGKITRDPDFKVLCYTPFSDPEYSKFHWYDMFDYISGEKAIRIKTITGETKFISLSILKKEEK